MSDDPTHPRDRRPPRLARLAGLLAALTGVAALAGWALDVAALRRVVPGQVEMKANAALGLLLAGSALALMRSGAGGRRAGRSLAALVALLGLLTVGEYLTGVGLGIDELLTRDPRTPAAAHPGRMAPATATGLLLIGVALLLLDAPRRRGGGLAQPLALAVGLLAFAVLVGHAYGAEPLYRFGLYTAVAAHTAAALLLLALGVLAARPRRGLLGLALAPTLGGLAVRRQLPVAVAVLALFGWARTAGQDAGLYGTALGTALLVTASVLVFGVLIAATGRRLHRLDLKQRAAAATVRDQAELLRATLAGVGDGLIATDAAGRVTLMNPVAEALTGWAQADAAGRPLEEVFAIANEATRAPVENPARRALREGVVVGLANHTVLLAKDGTEWPLDDSAAPIRDAAGGVVGAVLVFREITERKRAEGALAERVRLLRLGAEVGAALTRGGPLRGTLQSCAESLVRQLGGAFARVWTLNDAGGVLELQASAGLYTHTDGAHARVPVGQFKIGRIAQEREPHLTNGVAGDPQVPDQEWAAREGLVAFAGYPLLVGDRLVGVMAMFARAPLSGLTLEAMASVADEVALGIDRDRGERAARAAAEALRSSEERLRLTIDSARDYAIFTTGPDRRVATWNAGAERLFGWAEAEIVGESGDLLFTPEDRAAGVPAQEAEEAARAGRGVDERWHQRKDGSRFYASGVVTPLTDAAGARIGFTKVCRDETERKRAEQALRENEATLAAVLEALPVGVIIAEPGGRLARANRANAALWGGSPATASVEEYRGWVGYWPDSGRRVEPHEWAMSRALAGESVAGDLVEIERFDGGGRRLIINTAAPVRDAAGGVVGAVVAQLDVTDRVRAQAALRASEERLRLIVESARDFAIVTLDPAGVVTSWNSGARLIFGHEPGEIIGRHGRALFTPEDALDGRPEFELAAARAEGRAENERWHLKKDGTRFFASGLVMPLGEGAERGFLKIVRDRTDAERAEQALRASEDQFRAVVETVPGHLWTAEPGGAIDYAGPWLTAYTGVPPEALYGAAWAEVVHPDDLPGTLAAWRESLATGGPYSVEFRIRGRDGRFRWFRTQAIARRDAAGRVAKWFGYTGDADEQRAAAEALKDADRRKDEFLATLAHELRNPLAPIRNGLEVLRLAGPDAPAAEHARAMMERQLAQMVRLVDDLLDVSRITRGKLDLRPRRVELAAVLADAVETGRPLIEAAGHELRVDIGPGPIPLDADPTRLAQLFANLLTNAAKYTEPGGRVWLSARVEGNAAIASVRDTGVGLPPDMLTRVFDLFTQVDTSLSRSQGGLGIGLTLVKRLVEMHGGTVEARSDGPGRGSEFVVRLPLASSPAPDAPEADAEPALATGRRVLVADDNADSAESLGLLLTLMGHEVRIAHDGREAVDAAAEFDPDVVLLDIGMPRMDGYEACRAIRSLPGGARPLIVAQTGWGQDEDRRRSAEAGFDRHVVKPIDPAALAELLAEPGRGR